jgi:hypothetical protein
MEGTGPAPNGNIWTGCECLAGWQALASDPTIRFEVEHIDVVGDRAVIRWRITGASGALRCAGTKHASYSVL